MPETLQETLMRHEGLRLFPYEDTTGHLTIGVGRNLDEKGIREAEALYLLSNDIDEVTRSLRSNYSFFQKLNNCRQDILINMAFQLGLHGFSQFKRMIQALENADYATASIEMLDSKWAVQTPNRAQELARWMRQGQQDQ